MMAPTNSPTDALLKDASFPTEPGNLGFAPRTKSQSAKTPRFSLLPTFVRPRMFPDTRSLLTTSWTTDTLFDTQEVLSLMFTNSLPRDRVSSPTLPPKSPLLSFDWHLKLLLSDSLSKRPEVSLLMVLPETPSWMSKS